MSKDKTVEKIELLPCPFCGGEPLFEETVTERSVRCTNCSASIVRNVSTVLPQHVWNNRTELREANKRVEEAEKVVDRINAFPRIYGGTDAHDMAYNYRKTYPKVISADGQDGEGGNT